MDNALLPVGIGICVLSGYLDFMLFHNKNQWRQIVKKYDKLSKKKKTIRSILVIFFIALIYGNFVLSIYLNEHS